MVSAFFAAVSVAAVVIGVAGVVTFFLGLRRLGEASGSRKWPTVKGTVLTSKVEEQLSRHRDESDDADAPEQVSRTFKATVTYRYVVAEKTLEGARVAPDELETSDRSAADDLVRTFPPGAPVDVFYDPADPAQSVLKPGISGASAILPAIGVGLVVLGLSMFGIVWKVSGH